MMFLAVSIFTRSSCRAATRAWAVALLQGGVQAGQPGAVLGGRNLEQRLAFLHHVPFIDEDFFDVALHPRPQLHVALGLNLGHVLAGEHGVVGGEAHHGQLQRLVVFGGRVSFAIAAAGEGGPAQHGQQQKQVGSDKMSEEKGECEHEKEAVQAQMPLRAADRKWQQ